MSVRRERCVSAARRLRGPAWTWALGFGARHPPRVDGRGGGVRYPLKMLCVLDDAGVGALAQLSAAQVRDLLLFGGLFIVLAGGVVALLLFRQDLRRSRPSRSLARLEQLPTLDRLEQALAGLRQRDPKFDLREVEKQARRLFSLTRAPLESTDALPRTELSDGMFRRMLVQRALWKAEGRPVPAGTPEIDEVRTLGAFAEPAFDSLHVRVQWREAGSREERAEVLVFVRRPHARTVPVKEGKCPECGAPYPGGPANLCPFCRAVLNSGEYGWVLSQALELDAYRGPWREFLGVERMIAQDPGFSPECIEDRGALIFWKWIQSRVEQSPDRLLRFSDAHYRARRQERDERLAARGEREWLWQVRLHGVDLLKGVRENEEGFDEVHVRVRWSACHGVVDARWPRPSVPSTSQATVFTLVRTTGALTDLRRGISSDRCPSCNAALTEVEGVRCPFCETPFEPARTDFVLHVAREWEDWVVSQREESQRDRWVNPYLPSFKYPDQRQRLLQAMVAISMADGEVSPIERRLLHRCARRWRLPEAPLRQLLAQPTALPALPLEPGSWMAQSFVDALIAVAAMDGRIASGERKLIDQVCAKLGVAPPLPGALQTRAELVEESRPDL